MPLKPETIKFMKSCRQVEIKFDPEGVFHKNIERIISFSAEGRRRAYEAQLDVRRSSLDEVMALDLTSYEWQFYVNDPLLVPQSSALHQSAASSSSSSAPAPTASDVIGYLTDLADDENKAMNDLCLNLSRLSKTIDTLTAAVTENTNTLKSFPGRTYLPSWTSTSATSSMPERMVRSSPIEKNPTYK